ncbi:hypothetical protein IE81DRAFT_106495 [Ceraceosorus guamensis]|uniref:Uncharacterized protein n=1 Tax=Ceraceosorus guamensis TaxID=1522189 RepID=A0A316VZN8_9BASI|nr:hypothetical protein IE81DRAFT_106495 [Ceraceosorus guamensis]PWN42942.1 hypothetical protein IE81DRAFT_106495 [Ceraceosorus guamensis]
MPLKISKLFKEKGPPRESFQGSFDASKLYPIPANVAQQLQSGGPYNFENTFSLARGEFDVPAQQSTWASGARHVRAHAHAGTPLPLVSSDRSPRKTPPLTYDELALHNVPFRPHAGSEIGVATTSPSARDPKRASSRFADFKNVLKDKVQGLSSAGKSSRGQSLDLEQKGGTTPFLQADTLTREYSTQDGIRPATAPTPYSTAQQASNPQSSPGPALPRPPAPIDETDAIAQATLTGSPRCAAFGQAPHDGQVLTRAKPERRDQQSPERMGEFQTAHPRLSPPQQSNAPTGLASGRRETTHDHPFTYPPIPPAGHANPSSSQRAAQYMEASTLTQEVTNAAHPFSAHALAYATDKSGAERWEDVAQSTGPTRPQRFAPSTGTALQPGQITTWQDGAAGGSDAPPRAPRLPPAGVDPTWDAIKRKAETKFEEWMQRSPELLPDPNRSPASSGYSPVPSFYQAHMGLHSPPLALVTDQILPSGLPTYNHSGPPIWSASWLPSPRVRGSEGKHDRQEEGSSGIPRISSPQRVCSRDKSEAEHAAVMRSVLQSSGLNTSSKILFASRPKHVLECPAEEGGQRSSMGAPSKGESANTDVLYKHLNRVLDPEEMRLAFAPYARQLARDEMPIEKKYAPLRRNVDDPNTSSKSQSRDPHAKRERLENLFGNPEPPRAPGELHSAVSHDLIDLRSNGSQGLSGPHSRSSRTTAPSAQSKSMVNAASLRQELQRLADLQTAPRARQSTVMQREHKSEVVQISADQAVVRHEQDPTPTEDSFPQSLSGVNKGGQSELRGLGLTIPAGFTIEQQGDAEFQGAQKAFGGLEDSKGKRRETEPPSVLAPAPISDEHQQIEADERWQSLAPTGPRGVMLETVAEVTEWSASNGGSDRDNSKLRFQTERRPSLPSLKARQRTLRHTDTKTRTESEGSGSLGLAETHRIWPQLALLDATGTADDILEGDFSFETDIEISESYPVDEPSPLRGGRSQLTLIRPVDASMLTPTRTPRRTVAQGQWVAEVKEPQTQLAEGSTNTPKKESVASQRIEEWRKVVPVSEVGPAVMIPLKPATPPQSPFSKASKPSVGASKRVSNDSSALTSFSRSPLARLAEANANDAGNGRNSGRSMEDREDHFRLPVQIVLQQHAVDVSQGDPGTDNQVFVQGTPSSALEHGPSLPFTGTSHLIHIDDATAELLFNTEARDTRPETVDQDANRAPQALPIVDVVDEKVKERERIADAAADQGGLKLGKQVPSGAQRDEDLQTTVTRSGLAGSEALTSKEKLVFDLLSRENIDGKPAVEVLLSCYPRETRAFLRKNPRLLLLLTLRSQTASQNFKTFLPSIDTALGDGDKLLEPALEKILEYVTKAGEITSLQRSLLQLHQDLVKMVSNESATLDSRVTALEQAIFNPYSPGKASFSTKHESSTATLRPPRL